MPNILAHTHITTEVLGRARPDVILGSTLPDFKGMYIAKYGGFIAFTGISSELSRGKEFHSTTDSRFNAQPERPQMTAPLSADLEEAGIPYQASRLTADFAADILLDRALLDDETAIFNYRRIVAHVASPSNGLESGPFPVRFMEYVEDYFRRETPKYYADPKNIALMAAHRLAARSDDENRLIPENRVSVVAEVIGTHADRIGEFGLVAMRSTISQLRIQQAAA